MRYLLPILLFAIPLAAQPMKIDGTICRLNRAADRMIIGTDAGPRVRIAIEPTVTVTFEGLKYDREDVRPGDHVHIVGNRKGGAQVDATAIDVHVRGADALVDSLFPTHNIVGRFSVREAKTEFFSMHLPGQKYIRVDARSAYGPHGRVRASSLKSGDLLEVRGDWPSKDLLRASSIDVITDKESSSCRTQARRGENKDDTAAREADETKFLQGEG